MYCLVRAHFAVKTIWVPVSAVPVASCVVSDKFLDFSEQNKDDSAHLTRRH